MKRHLSVLGSALCSHGRIQGEQGGVARTTRAGQPDNVPRVEPFETLLVLTSLEGVPRGATRDRDVVETLPCSIDRQREVAASRGDIREALSDLEGLKPVTSVRPPTVTTAAGRAMPPSAGHVKIAVSPVRTARDSFVRTSVR